MRELFARSNVLFYVLTVDTSDFAELGLLRDSLVFESLNLDTRSLNLFANYETNAHNKY